jgi:hypothetical protein
MNASTSRITDSIMRMFGACYIEDKLGKIYEKDAEFKKLISDMKQSELRNLRRHYEAAKGDKNAMKEPFMDILANVFEKQNENVEKAKKLLEKHGYEIIK